MMKFGHVISICLVVVFSTCTASLKKNKLPVYSEKDIVVIEIPSNLGQGYQWRLFDTLSVKILEHTSKPNPDIEESTDLEVFKLRASRKGHHELIFYSVRPFEKDFDTLKTKKITKKFLIK